MTVYLLTGMPGTGKTSLIRQVVKDMAGKAGGFYTEELRLQGIRQGFRLVTLDGRSATLAHINIKSPYKVSKYGVDVRALEEVGVPALRQALKVCELVVIDEIGKMELFSGAFKAVVQEIIESGKKVLGTIMAGSDPWADEIKKKLQLKLIVVTRNNHAEVKKEIQEWLGIQSTK